MMLIFKKICKGLGVALFSFLLIAGTVTAAVGINSQISYIAILKDSTGTLLPDGNLDMVFSIYDAPSGGAVLWTGNYTAANGNPVSILNGVVNVYLGSGTGNALPINIFLTDTLYLGVTIGTDPEMSPRVRVTSAAQAINSHMVDGKHATDFLLSAGTTALSGTLGVTPTWAQALQINPFSTSAGSTGEVQFNELIPNGTEYVGIKAPDSIASSYTLVLPNAAGSAGQLLGTTGSGTLTWVNPGACGTCLLTGGNAFGTTITVGSTDSNEVQIITSGSPRLSVLSNGNVGIGTITAPYLLTVAGTVAPSVTLVYDLGSQSNQWRSLYVGSTTASGTGTYGGVSAGYGSFSSLNSTGTASLGGFYGPYATFTGLGVTATSSSAGLSVTNFANFTGSVLIGTTTGGSYPLTVAGTAAPASNLLYDLGSFSNQWRSLFVGSQTVTGTGTFVGLRSLYGYFDGLTTAATTTSAGLDITNYATVGGPFNVSGTMGASVPGIGLTGSWFTGGSTTTTKPAVLVEPTGATSNAWSTSGTGLGVNSAAGFVGNLLDLQVNGVHKFTVDYTGKLSLDPSLPFTINTGGVDRVVVSSSGTISFPYSGPSFLINGSDTFSVNDTNGNNLAEIKSLGQNFGGLVEAGATVSRNSYFGEEFSQERAQISTTTDRNWGNTSAFGTDEINGIGNCTWNIIDDTANGVSRMENLSTGNGCLMYNSQAVGDAFLQFYAANLPVALIKARPSTVSASNLYYIGLGDAADATGNDPDSGLYFRNNNNIWEAVAMDGGTETSLSCGVTVSTSQFALMKIEVLTATSARFYIDNNVSNGVSYTLCGTITSNVPSSGLAAMLKMQTVTVPADLDVDYVRIWQDDNKATDNGTPMIVKPQDLITQSSLAFGYDFMGSETQDVGTVMSLVSHNGFKQVAPSRKVGDGNILGVVTENAGLTLGQIGKDRLPLATFGRALVKVQATSDIAVGDFLTSSKTAGVADKAVASGIVLGRSLEAVSKGEEKLVLVQLQISWQNVGNRFEIESAEPLVSEILQPTSTEGQGFASSFLINQKSVGNLIQLQQDGVDRFVIDNAGGVHISTELTDPNIPVLSVSNNKQALLVVKAGGVVEINAKIHVGKDTAGVVTIPFGQTKATVKFSVPYDNTPIIILTPVNNPRVKFGVSNPTTDGFEVEVDDSLGNEVQLNWLVVGEILH